MARNSNNHSKMNTHTGGKYILIWKALRTYENQYPARVRTEI